MARISSKQLMGIRNQLKGAINSSDGAEVIIDLKTAQKVLAMCDFAIDVHKKVENNG